LTTIFSRIKHQNIRKTFYVETSGALVTFKNYGQTTTGRSMLFESKGYGYII
jgi:hypothetical protein